jgi:hypothetical protein
MAGVSKMIFGQASESGMAGNTDLVSQVPPMVTESIESTPFKVGGTDELDIAAFERGQHNLPQDKIVLPWK